VQRAVASIKTMTKTNDVVKVKYKSAFGVTRHRVVGRVTREIYGFFKDGDIFEIDKADQKAEPHRFELVDPPKPTRKRRTKRKVEEAE